MRRILSFTVISILSILVCMRAVSFAKDIVLKPVWARGGPDDTVSFNHPMGFCIEPNFQHIYVADTGNDRIVMFDKDGEFLGIFFTSIKIKRPFDIICGPDGHIYISQMDNPQIAVFDRNGAHIFYVPKAQAYDEGVRPGRMALDTHGMLIFGDRSSGEIFIISQAGEVVSRFAHHKKTERDLLTGVWVGANRQIYTTWAQGTAVGVFNYKGEVLFQFGHHRLMEDGFSFPSSLTLDAQGRIWIIDTFRHTVKVFQPDGQYLFQTGTINLMFPIDIEFDKNGRIYILEKGEGRIQAFLLGPEE